MKNEQKGMRHGESKGVEDCFGMPALQVATSETVMRLFKGWLPKGRRGVEHGGA
jgi:hypothetical protein